MLWGMVAPVMSLALILGLGGAWVIDQSVQAVNDRILSAASRAIVDSLKVEDGSVGLNLSPAIFGMLEDAARDNVYYSVRHRGRVLTGYDDLPDIAPPTLADTKVAFGDATYLGRPVRVVAEARRLPQIDGVVVVQVAETLDARRRISRRLLAGLALLETRTLPTLRRSEGLSPASLHGWNFPTTRASRGACGLPRANPLLPSMAHPFVDVEGGAPAADRHRHSPSVGRGALRPAHRVSTGRRRTLSARGAPKA